MAGIVCEHCGYQNPLGGNFCSSCGRPTTEQAGDNTAAIDAATSSEISHVEGMLVVRQGSKRGSQIMLDQPETTLGRHPESDVFLDDITVSRRHATISRGEHGYTVADAGSLNGTYINRELVEQGPLQDGDELRVGKFRLVFVALGDE